MLWVGVLAVSPRRQPHVTGWCGEICTLRRFAKWIVIPHEEKLMPTAEEIYAKVRETLVDALGVDDDEVTPEATLVGDLGAESIDFLDIVFRLEKNFSIKIPRGELFPESLAADTSLVKDGKVTEQGIQELRTRMSHADIEKFAQDPKVENIQDLFTVQMIVKFIEKKLAGGAA
jgi:acyl carrier protein